MTTATRDVFEAIAAYRVVPVVVLDDAGSAQPLGDALVAGGLPVAEVTFRTPAAEAALRTLAGRGDLVVGAGTVVRPEQVERAAAAGAQFVVSPGVSRRVVETCQRLGMPVLPGVATVTEVMTAMELGVDVVKFFPAETAGGVRAIAALAAPFPAIRFVPTGGIGAAQLPDYLGQRSVLAVGGSWMVAKALVADGNFADVTRLSAEAVEVAAALRARKETSGAS